jgi:hypothetical protein
MVTLPGASLRRRGASTLGCLFVLLLAAVVVYYGIDVGRVYWKYYKLTDEMEQSARFAQDRSDEEIRQHLIVVARDLELPRDAQRFVIQRTPHPPVVSIRTEYRVTLELPFHHRVLVLKPHVEVRQ